MNITLKQLTAFTAVARLGSFTRAAEELHVSQPALTATVNQCEELLGVKLFDRTTRRVNLTQEAENFLPVAQSLIADFEAAVADVRAVAELRRGRVRIATLPSVAVELLPEIVSGFSEEHPGVSVQIHDANASDVQRMVARAEVDFGIANQWEADPDLDFRRLIHDPMVLVCRADHPLAKGRGALAWKKLAGYPFIGSASASGIHPLLQGLRDVPDNIRRPHYEVSHIATLIGLLMAGLGISALPALAVPRYRGSELVVRPLVGPAVEREIAIIIRHGRSLPPAAEAMAAMIRAKVPARWT